MVRVPHHDSLLMSGWPLKGPIVGVCFLKTSVLFYAVCVDISSELVA